MAWIRLDDQIAHHPKFLKAGPVASWLWVTCIGYAQKFLTDGFIPTEALPTLGTVTDTDKIAADLVSAGLLTVVQGGFQIHDYLDFNESAHSVKERRRQDRVRKESSRNPAGIQPESSRTRARARAPAIPSHPIHTVVKKKTNAGPIFKGSRFVVMPFMQDELQRMLGNDFETFGLSDWYFALDEKLSKNGAVDTDWPWLKSELRKEAMTRGLMLPRAKEHQRRGAERAPRRPEWKCPHTPSCLNRNDCGIREALGR